MSTTRTVAVLMEVTLTAAVLLIGALPGPMDAQRPAAAAKPLVFDAVTVVDVAEGRLLPDHRVVVIGNRIQAVGVASTIKVPSGAHVIPAAGKYLIPGLWDMNVRSRRVAHFFYPLLLANGVTGIRDAGSDLPLTTLISRRQEMLAGTRVGPPRQILSGPSIADGFTCKRGRAVCADDSTQIRHLVDSLKAAGADVVTVLQHPVMEAVILAEARRAGLSPGLSTGVGGGAGKWTAMEASDSGVSIFDHIRTTTDLDRRCFPPQGSVAECRPVAERFQRNRTWWVPALLREFHTVSSWAPPWRKPGPASEAVLARFYEVTKAFWSGSAPQGNWLHDVVNVPEADSLRILSSMRQAGLPLLAGTDTDVGVSDVSWKLSPGFALHVELVLNAIEGLTPLAALRSATLTPAEFLHATDSLGTVAPGKLADLVLLDANPLADITNTTTIRAVVANGRYFDRATLDRVLAEVRQTTRDHP